MKNNVKFSLHTKHIHVYTYIHTHLIIYANFNSESIFFLMCYVRMAWHIDKFFGTYPHTHIGATAKQWVLMYSKILWNIFFLLLWSWRRKIELCRKKLTWRRRNGMSRDEWTVKKRKNETYKKKKSVISDEKEYAQYNNTYARMCMYCIHGILHTHKVVHLKILCIHIPFRWLKHTHAHSSYRIAQR